MHHEEGGPGGGKSHFHPCCRQAHGENSREGGEPEDHLDQSAAAWERAFWKALHEVRVEMMKERIRAAWGEGMKETADGVLAAMHADWKKFRELEAAEEAKAGPREALRAVLKEGLKRGPQ